MGVQIIGELVQKNGLNFPIIDTNNIRGGFYLVSTIAERDSIPASRKKEGMLCYVSEDEDKIYTYLWNGIEWIKNKVASLEGDGLMSKEDKKKLDNLVYDGLDSNDSNKALSAKQGKSLKELLDSKVIEVGGIPIDTEPIEGNITHIVNSDGLAKKFNKHNTEINAAVTKNEEQDQKLSELEENIGDYSLEFEVKQGNYITNSTIIYCNISNGDTFSTCLYIDSYTSTVSIQVIKQDDSKEKISTLLLPNKVYTFTAKDNYKGVIVYSDKPITVDSQCVFAVKTNLSVDKDYTDTKTILNKIDLESQIEKRLFNEITVKQGKFLKTTGALDEDSNGFYSQLIPVVLGDKFDYTGESYYNNTCLFVCFDMYGKVISYDVTSGHYEHKIIEINDDRISHIRFGSYKLKPVITRIIEPIDEISLESMQSYVDEKCNSVEGKVNNLEEKIDKIKIDVRPKTSYNLFNKDTVTQGYYVKFQDGQLSPDSKHVASDYIPVEVGNIYSFPVDAGFFGVGGAVQIPCYDENKSYIGTNAGTLNGAICTVNISVANAKYIRITAYFDSTLQRNKYKWKQTYDTLMVVNSDTYPSRYYPYGEIPQYIDGEFSAHTNEFVNPLFGKSVIFDGDSICAANGDTNNYGWAGRIGTKNMMMWNNFAVGGGTFTNGEWNTHVISETDYGNANPDYIIIEGGTNDADRVGSILNGNTPEKYGSFTKTGYTNEFTTNTYCGAIEALFKRLLTNYPGAKIGVIVAHKMGVSQDYTKEGNNRRAYFETLIQLCEKWGIPYINLWDKGRLNPRLSSYYTEGSDNNFYQDGQHLTQKGYDVLTPMIEAWMKTL